MGKLFIILKMKTFAKMNIFKMNNYEGTRRKLNFNKQTLKIRLMVKKKQLVKSHMGGSATHLLGSVQNPASCSVAEKKIRAGAAGWFKNECVSKPATRGLSVEGKKEGLSVLYLKQNAVSEICTTTTKKRSTKNEKRL